MQTRSQKNIMPVPSSHEEEYSETDDPMTDDEDILDEPSRTQVTFANSRSNKDRLETETRNFYTQSDSDSGIKDTFIKRSSTNDSNARIFYLILSLVVVILAAVCFSLKDSIYMIFPVGSVQHNYTCENGEFVLEHISAIKDKFSSQPENTWYTFASGINQLFTVNPTGPAAFLLFHQPGDETVNCLVKEVSDLAARCFNGKASVFSITGEMLNDEPYIKDSGELMVRFKDEITDKKVMIVYGLNDVPAEVAKEFHYFCDIYQPFVKNAVYFFTLKQQVADNRGNVKVITAVNNELKDLWRNLTYDKLDALITRMTSNVVQVNSEKNIKC